jgi:CheY-like chemotaxis protein
VLVVDDEFGVADLIDTVLTDEGHRVLTAANGRQGLELLAKEHLTRAKFCKRRIDASISEQAIIGEADDQ